MRIALRKALLTIATLAVTAVAQSNPPAPTPAAQDNDKIVQFLSTTVSWYRQRTAEEKLANEPADVTYEQENSTIADQVVQQAFEYDGTKPSGKANDSRQQPSRARTRSDRDLPSHFKR